MLEKKFKDFISKVLLSNNTITHRIIEIADDINEIVLEKIINNPHCK